MADAAPIRVMVVDDHPLIRLGLARFIDAQEDMEVVAQADCMSDALRQLPAARPDLVTVDVSMRGGDGFSLIRRLREADRGVRVLVVSMHADAVSGRRALEAGAMGYVNKDEAPERVIEAIRIVGAGQVYPGSALGSEGAGRGGGGGAAFEPPRSPEAALSERELAIFTLLGEGFSTTATAQRLGVSKKTIETHRERMKHKLGMVTGRELLQLAVRWVMERDKLQRHDTPEVEPPDAE